MLLGRKAIVTGASSGIGKAIAQVFAKEGARVAACGRNVDALRDLDLTTESGNHHCVVEGDLTQKGVCTDVVARSVDELGGLDILVNCAGVLKGATMQDTTLDTWHFNFAANTHAVFEMMHFCVPHMSKGSSILNISSVNGLQSFGGTAAYCASKAATDQLTRCASVDLAPLGVRVNAINPGLVVTELQKRGGMSDEVYEDFLQRAIDTTHPLAQALQRVATPEEVAHLAVFLSSDKAAFITGDCIAIDGGRQNLGAR